jgi:hypothetical protein
MKCLITVLSFTAVIFTANASPQFNFQGVDCNRYSKNAQRQEKSAQTYYNEHAKEIDGFHFTLHNANKNMYRAILEQAERSREVAATCEAWQANESNTNQVDSK